MADTLPPCSAVPSIDAYSGRSAKQALIVNRRRIGPQIGIQYCKRFCILVDGQPQLFGHGHLLLCAKLSTGGRSRRELIRTLFNDFWSERDDKPPAFVDRLNEAETYLNERLAACGELWHSTPKHGKC